LILKLLARRPPLAGFSFAADEVLSLVKDRDKLATALLGGTT
jgi:hypothetical protein